MSGSRVQRGRSGRGVSALALAAVLGLAGCTDDTPSDPPTSESATSEAEETVTADGPTPEELSQLVHDAAEAQDGAPALGSATGTLAGGQSLTVEVLAVERQEASTLVRMRWTSPTMFDIGFSDFYDLRREGSNVNFARTLFLEDPTTAGLRWLPLLFEDYRSACTCPYFPLEVGPEPQVVTAVYPALPAGTTTVDLRVNRSGLVVTGLPVS